MSYSPYIPLPAILAALCATLCAPAAAAQQILEVDLSAGRTIIDDQWRSMGSIVLAVDHDRGILYVNDAEEPEGIMAFSLSTGERIRVLGAGRRWPARVLPRHSGMTMGPGGGLYVSGVLRVVEFDSTGVPVSSWTPRAPTSKPVCNFGGQPAVPAQNGVIRRGPDGTDEGIGPNVVNSHVLVARDREEGAAIGDRIWSARIACTDDAAYVAMEYPGSPDTVFVYHRNGEEARLPVPTEFTEDLPECTQRSRLSNGVVLPERPCPTWNERLYLSLDGRGNIVLMGNHAEIAGAVVNPETGCYAVLRKSEANPALRVARIYADSALVFTRDTERTTVGRTTRVVMHTGANRVSLHAIRRVSGEGCEGMVGGGGGSVGSGWFPLSARRMRPDVPGICGDASAPGGLARVARKVRGRLLYGMSCMNSCTPDLSDIPTTDVIPAQEGEERDRWAGPALPLEVGLNGLRCDLRTDPAATFPGIILWGVRTMSPAVPPGTHAVRLTLDGRVEETQVEVRRNPWNTDVTDEDLFVQYEFGVWVRDQVDAANSAVSAIRGVKAQLEERPEAVDDDETLMGVAELVADGGFGGGGGHLRGAEPVEPGPAELSDQGDQPAAQLAVDVGARGRAARKRDVCRVRHHGGAAGGVAG